MLAQYGLSRTEVERWLMENGSPSLGEGGAEPNARGKSRVSPTRVRGGQLWPMAAVASEALTGVDYGQAAAGLGASLGASGHGGGARESESYSRFLRTQQKLRTFEEQVRYVAQQAAQLRSQSQQLRGDEHVDQARLDAVLALLNRATIGAAEGYHAPQEAHSSSGSCSNSTQHEPSPSSTSMVPHQPPQLMHHPPELILPPEALVQTRGRHHIDRGGPEPLSMQHQPRQTGLPHRSRRRNHKQEQLQILRKWFDAHSNDPYPSPDEKVFLADQVGMEVRQVEHWFTNRRKRHWKKGGGGAKGEEDDDDEDSMRD